MKRRNYPTIILLLVFLTNSSAFSQATLIKDLFPGDTLFNNADPDNLLKINGTVYFSAKNEYGKELWKTDGTASGTVLVKDINPGDLGNITGADSDPTLLTDVNGTLFFYAYTGLNGKELWKSDGTESGTILLKDINPGIGPSLVGAPQKMVDFNGLLYFVAFDPVAGSELWKSDGTPAGTELAIDFIPGSTSSDISNLTVVNGVLYFTAYNYQTNDTELWKTDGTVSGTVMVKDINPGSSSSMPGNLFDYNGELFFLADDGANGRELWKSNGTEAGTVLVKDINPGSGSSLINYLTVCNNAIYFSASNGSNGAELWKSDGTEIGTEFIKDINSGSLGSDPQNFVALNQIIYFTASTFSNGLELWMTDGTEIGTVLVKDINTGLSSSNPGRKIVIGNTFFFAANDASNGRELWKSDGTEAGTVLVKNIHNATNSANPDLLMAFNTDLLFTATNFQHGKELWKSDGTENGTQILREIGKQQNSSNPAGFTVFNNEIYFSAYVGGDFNGPNFTGGELWKTDGTEQGTVLVKDIEPGPGGYGASELTVCNNLLFFTFETNASGKELWRTDGTEAGTMMVKNIAVSSSTGSNPSLLTVMNSNLYFVANDGSNGKELWKTDGTEAGTVLVKNINQYSNSSNPNYLTVLGQELFFSASDGVNGNELWKTDGTEVGTVLVKDIKTGFTSSNPKNLMTFNGNVYFNANNGTNGKELWKSDGTSAGTVMVKDIFPGTDSGLPNELTAVGNELFFTAVENNSDGFVLWKTDGTEAGTTVVINLTIDPIPASIAFLTEAGGKLFFIANQPNSGIELWKSDGTSAGTVLVKDIYPGMLSSGPQNLKNINGTLYFTAFDDAFGMELWKSDGTECSTQPLADINPGMLGIFNSGNEYIAHNNAIYLNGANKDVGNEIWKIEITDNIDEYAFNAFVLPSEVNSCTGTLNIEFDNLGTYTLSINSGQPTEVTGMVNFTDYCSGIYDLSISDACGNNYNTYFIIPSDSSYIYINPFQDSIALDSLGHILENCEILYSQIDTAYIDSIWANGNTVNVIWNIIDSNGSNFDTTSYVLNNGNGVYWLQMSVFCPFKSANEYFTVTEAVYFNNGSVSTVGLADIGKNLFQSYPNPTNDQVHISFSGPDAELTVYDAQGKMVLKDRIQNQEIISLQNFERGVYLFDFKNSDGHTVQRVVKY